MPQLYIFSFPYKDCSLLVSQFPSPYTSPDGMFCLPMIDLCTMQPVSQAFCHEKPKIAMEHLIQINWKAIHHGCDNNKCCHDTDGIEEDSIAQIMLLWSPSMLQVFIVFF